MILNELEKLVIQYSVKTCSIKRNTLEQLITTNLMRIKTDDKYYSKEVINLSKILSAQTRNNIPPSVFRSLLNVCFDSKCNTIEDYIKILNILKVEVI